MGARAIGDFRNIALVGHSAAGKTTLGEALLLKAGVTSRLGSVDDGSSILDAATASTRSIPPAFSSNNTAS